MQKPKSSVDPTPLSELLHASVDACKAERKRKREADGEGPVGDEEILKLARHTRNYALAPYRQFLWYVPRLVNVVSLAEAVPAEGSGVTLPLDLRKIASRCRGAFYAPARFAAVQLAFSQPRSRILIFHTGRLVGTGAYFATCVASATALMLTPCPQARRARLRHAWPSPARNANLQSKLASTSTSSPSRSSTQLARSRCGPRSTATHLPPPTAPTHTTTVPHLLGWRGVRRAKVFAAVRGSCHCHCPAFVCL